MEKVITVLSEIEDKATKILDRTKDQKQQLYKQLNRDIAKLEQEIRTETNTKLARLQETMNAEIEEEKRTLLENCEEELVSLDTTFQANHEALAEEIFARIIKP